MKHDIWIAALDDRDGLGGIVRFGPRWLCVVIGWCRWQVELGCIIAEHGPMLVVGWPLERPSYIHCNHSYRVGLGPFALRWWLKARRP